MDANCKLILVCTFLAANAAFSHSRLVCVYWHSFNLTLHVRNVFC